MRSESIRYLTTNGSRVSPGCIACRVASKATLAGVPEAFLPLPLQLTGLATGMILHL